MNSTCEKMKPLISEYIDETLDARRKADIERHLPHCPDCRDLAESFRSNKERLRALPLRQTSSTFDAQLASRIAAMNRPPVRRSWLDMFVDAFQPTSRMLRPAFATVAGVAAVVTVCMINIRPITVTQSPGNDAALIAQCVDQHRSFVETQPLADMSAQSLAGQLDSDDTAATDNQSTEESL